MSKLTKHEIRDDAIHDVLAEGFGNILLTLRDHWRFYASVVGGLLIVAIGAVLLLNMRSSKVQKASELLSKVQSAYSASISPSGALSAPVNEDNPTFPNEEARRKEVEKYIAEIKAKGAGTPERIAIIYSALDDAGSGKPDEALKALTPLTTDSTLGPLALKLRAKLYEGQDKWDLAEADWKTLSTEKNPVMPDGEGMYMLGQYYERRSQKEKALEAYEKGLNLLASAPDENPLKTRLKGQVASLKGTA